MSNFRVRQVMALKGVNHRQRYLLIGLATWLDDDSRSVRVSVPNLIESSGLARNTWRIARRELEKDAKVASETTRGRGHLGLWTAHCLPEKGVNDADPNPPGEKGSIPGGKRGQVQDADQAEPDRGLNRRAKPAAGARDAVALDEAAQYVADFTDATEAEAAEISKRWHAKPGIHSVVAVLRSKAKEQLQAEVHKVRKQAGKAEVAKFLAWAKGQPPCGDGQPGGDQIRPDTGQALCPLCRAREKGGSR